MSTISKERLIKIQQWRETYGPGSNVVLPAEEAEELARIALASLEAEPAIHRWRRVTSEPYGPYPWHYGDFIGFSKPVDGIEDEYFYSAPPEPANAEPVAWLWSHRKHPSEVSLVRPEDDERAEGAHWSGWSCQALYAAPPAPVSVPAAMEMDDDFDSAFEHGKAVGWNAYRAAMLQGSQPVSNRDELPEDVSTVLAESYQVVGVMAEALGIFDDAAVQKVMDNLSQQKLVHSDVLPFSLPTGSSAVTVSDEHVRYESNAGGNLWIQCSKQKYEKMKLAGMLTRVLYERSQNSQQNIPENIPTLREAVDTIRSSGISIDAEKIQAERDSVNCPAIPDCWVACSERMPPEYEPVYIFHPDYGVSQYVWYDHQEDAFVWDDETRFRELESVSHWMAMPAPPAAPQQEVK